MDLSGIDNIIFDLGGVIIDLDYDRMYQSFAEKSGKDVHQILNDFKAKKIFEKFEVNDISAVELRNLIREHFHTGLSDQEIDDLWNSLLGNIPKERIDLIEDLKEDFRVYLLSNTNYIHVPEVNRRLKASTGIDDLDEIFDRIFYSHEIKMRKPDIQIYEYVTRELDIDKSRTLFIDDLETNINGAKEAGWKTIHLTEGLTILDVLK